VGPHSRCWRSDHPGQSQSAPWTRCGADGLKTGHTDEAGYGFTGSAEQNGRRIIMVVAGLGSFNQRIDESVKFMNWGFRAWQTQPLFTKGKHVGKAQVQLGDDG
jgi:D-alanyl-D-alanine carboxypeptidase (penicillin-binding protein 5/6)